MKKIWKKKNKNVHEFLPDALEIIESPISPIGSAVIWLVFSILIIAMIWSYIGRVDMVSTARGQIIPNGNVKVIQPYENAVITSILVEEGAFVRKDEVLVTLDTGLKDVDLLALDEAIDKTGFEILVIDSIIESGFTDVLNVNQLSEEQNVIREYYLSANDNFQKKIDIANNQNEQNQVKLEMSKGNIEVDQNNSTYLLNKSENLKTVANSNIPEQEVISSYELAYELASSNFEKSEELFNSGIISLSEFEDAKNKLFQAKSSLDYQFALIDSIKLNDFMSYEDTFNEYQSQNKELSLEQSQIKLYELQAVESKERIKSLELERKEFFYSQLRDKQNELSGYESQRDKINKSVEYSKLKSPVDGIVYNFAFNNVGELAIPGESLITIVPQDTELTVEAKLLNKDIGYINVGQDVIIKVDTFPFQKFKTLKGTVESISPSSMFDQQLGYVYLVKVRLDEHYLELDGNVHELIPGMDVTVEIKTGKRRIIDFFLEPLVKYLDESIKLR